MGHGSYSSVTRSATAFSKGYTDKSKSVAQIFTQKVIHNQMSPNGVFRESRDSDEHPNTVPIIIGLDVTGSMGKIPRMFIADGLPTIVDSIFRAGIMDPQIMFMALGDHEYDESPLQVGQFESSDELMDKWLEKVYVEGGGGGNGGESYFLAWVFAGHHTEHDAFKNRGKKGFLFTIGDEATLTSISDRELKGITGRSQYKEQSALDFLAKAQETYDVYHLHITETAAGRSQKDQAKWREILGDHVIFVDDYKKVPEVIAGIVAANTSKEVTNVQTIFTTPASTTEETVVY